MVVSRGFEACDQVLTAQLDSTSLFTINILSPPCNSILYYNPVMHHANIIDVHDYMGCLRGPWCHIAIHMCMYIYIYIYIYYPEH